VTVRQEARSHRRALSFSAFCQDFLRLRWTASVRGAFIVATCVSGFQPVVTVLKMHTFGALPLKD
jgi:hypothetical protein